jgi:hypothetical protein
MSIIATVILIYHRHKLVDLNTFWVVMSSSKRRQLVATPLLVIAYEAVYPF